MTDSPTSRECIENWNLWADYIDPMATVSHEEFDAMTLEAKAHIVMSCFGTADYDGSLDDLLDPAVTYTRN